ncbi:hypothetical protein EMCRGX_G009406 [Ephydatia muelleri]
MVVLGQVFSLLKMFPKGADRGLYAGKGIMHGHTVTFSNKKTKRIWRPNVQKKDCHSDILGMSLRLRLTTSAMRCIDKAGGFDGYIYNTPDKKLASKLGVSLKRRMHAIVAGNPNVQPPEFVKRLPRPPRSLTEGAVKPQVEPRAASLAN